MVVPVMVLGACCLPFCLHFLGLSIGQRHGLMTHHHKFLIEERQVECLDKNLARTDIENGTICTTLQEFLNFGSSRRFRYYDDFAFLSKRPILLKCANGLAHSIPQPEKDQRWPCCERRNRRKFCN